MNIVVKGRVWKFGDNINTDYMAPGFVLNASWEEVKKHILHIHKDFAPGCQPGDVIVAGRNFGCGSSREVAPANLKRLGIAAVVAESFGRIFFRNCVAIGLPAMTCEGVTQHFEEGQELELDFEKAQIRNVTTGKDIRGKALSPDLINIVKHGGVLALLTEEARHVG